MFHNIPEPILKRMRELEAKDAIDQRMVPLACNACARFRL
jgi:hypothetical protein